MLKDGLMGSLQFWSEPTKIVYRKVSSIIVCLVADESESELGLLDLIQGKGKGSRLLVVLIDRKSVV